MTSRRNGALALVFSTLLALPACEGRDTPSIDGPTPAPAAGADAPAARPPMDPAALVDALRRARAITDLAESEGWKNATAVYGGREFGGADIARPVDAQHIRLLVGSNIRAELEDCGCPRNPLGGLARRATIFREGDPDGVPAFHVDAGDTLTQRANGAGLSEEQLVARAEGVARALVASDLDAMAIGANELALSPARLRALAQSTRLPLLSANVLHGGATVAPAWRAAMDDGVTIGIVGTLADDHLLRNESETPWSIAPSVEATAAAVREARAADVRIVVLLASGGFARVEELLAGLRAAGTLPDLVAVSGSARMMRGVSFVEGVPIVETGDRGKHLMWLDLYLAPGPEVHFLSPESAGQSEVRRWLTAARALRATQRGMASLSPDDHEGLQGRRQILEAQRARELELRTAAQRALQTQPIREGDNASTVEAELVDVVLTIEEAEDVKAIVEATKSAMAMAAQGAAR